MNLWLWESLKSLEIYSKIICADYCDWLSFRGATCRSWILCSRKVSGGEEYIKQTSNRESDNNAIVSKRDSFCVELTLEIFSLGFVIQGVSSSLITGCVDSSGFKWSPGGRCELGNNDCIVSERTRGAVRSALLTPKPNICNIIWICYMIQIDWLWHTHKVHDKTICQCLY